MVAKEVKACLLDIEGTTTSISFVKDELFPYVLKNISSYFDKNWNEKECQDDVKALIDQAAKDSMESGITVNDISSPCAKDDLIKYVQWLMDRDSKTTPLKALQGHMWREAYENGNIKGHLFDDVSVSLKHWHKQRVKLYIYSSGSVNAQKLLFKHSIDGDLTKYLSGYFDTKIGNKREKQSYVNILEEIGLEGSSVLFLTDIPHEGRAAEAAGLQVLLLCRPGNAPLSDEDKEEFETIEDFQSLTLTLDEKDREVDEMSSAKKTACADEETTSQEQ